MQINLDTLIHPLSPPSITQSDLTAAQQMDADARAVLTTQIQALAAEDININALITAIQTQDPATAAEILGLQQQDVATNALVVALQNVDATTATQVAALVAEDVSINALVVALQAQDAAANTERSLMQSQITALQALLKRRGTIIPFEGSASATQTFLGDATNPSTEWELGWEGSNRMGRLRTKPGSGIGWFDITIIKVDGNSTTIRVSADDISAQENVWKYFSTSGNLNANFSHENYSAVSQVFAVAESNSGKSFLHMVFHSGNTNHLTGTIRVHNISDLS